MEVHDLLLKPPTDNPYDTLKVQLIKRTAASEQHKLQQLISGEELGDRKPTQLLRRMQQLLGDKLGTGTDANSFLRELFLQRLPPSVRMVLASADPSTTLDNLADMADKIMEVATPTISTLSTVRVDNSKVKQLHEEVSPLTDLVASLSHNHRAHRCTRPPSRTRLSVNTPPPNQPPTQDVLCWYHAKFGAKAQKCREPCNWRQGNSETRP